MISLYRKIMPFNTEGLEPILLYIGEFKNGDYCIDIFNRATSEDYSKRLVASSLGEAFVNGLNFARMHFGVVARKTIYHPHITCGYYWELY